ncbi:hypothetical protein BDZ45DRAFT_742498 [Acephala macrosclerotiorum]|nr:hypothetical protein BDZ45DRAFT_742498 [Acephala macrosclerotiorum]
MTAASGSPAFKGLVANEDAFTVRMLEAGAILIGKTNSHPWRRAVCREDSTVEQEVSTTQTSFAAFGMGKETVSLGTGPASNNGLVAYTPSRGMRSICGNW